MLKSPQEQWAEVLQALDTLATLTARIDDANEREVWDVCNPMPDWLHEIYSQAIDQQLNIVSLVIALHERGALDDVGDLLDLVYGGS